MLLRERQTSFLFGGNAPYVEEQYELYLADPASVTHEWRAYFDALRETPAIDGSDRDDEPHGPVVSSFIEMAKRPHRAAAPADSGLALARKQVAVQSLITAFRTVGTRTANLDPLQWTPPRALAELTPAYYGLTAADMSTQFSTADTFLFEEDVALRKIVAALEDTYTGTLGAEFTHITDANEQRWWQLRLESTRAKPSLSVDEKRRILERLVAAEGIEKFLHTRYAGQKRFSLEGGESLIVLLDELVRYGASKKVRSVVMGMAHRGRLNVLVNIVGKPHHALFDEFEGKGAGTLQADDVKYHKGFSGVAQTEAGPVEVVLAFNPSHLEIVNPVVQGMARAKAETLDGADASHILPIEIHGDAAISGQGVVMETLSLSYTRGHGTGGTVHVVVNNQIGFTTSDPRDTRSSFYSTDIAKMIEAPVLHVNGDDPEAVVMAVRLALDYRTQFKRSVVIDLVCFRKHGHQEQDTPGITQPLMYRAIAAHPGVKTLYARKLVEQGTVTSAEVEGYVQRHRDSLERARDTAAPQSASTHEAAVRSPSIEAQSRPSSDVALSAEQVRSLAQRISSVPQEYELHPLVARMVAARREMAAGTKPVDWAMAEQLAFASLLGAGVDVRLSGQDSERGTFNQRHAVLHNQRRTSRTDGVFIPLAHVGEMQGRFTVTNSVLSEAAVLAFEYGYSTVHGNALVMWEAQFGDFANGAQVVIDQFIAAGAAKWGQRSALTLFLPHGQEGQGPEHASARLERYLQLSAQDNMRVIQPTTPAQLFHMLRMQGLVFDRRPLIVMTPKSLLRHPAAVSALDELAHGAFHEILTEGALSETISASMVERIILTSGKVYYELLEYRRTAGMAATPIVRVEQLYPFPSTQLAAELARYPNLKSVVWCQEESRNQGAWSFVEPRLREVMPPGIALMYAGPEAGASTAPGSQSAHSARQSAVLAAAFAE
ncbi:2-oxoglutarate dehydrogenase E1 component [Paraburkholderia sp. T12-10]|nr:2-oxoglutarate dehydrogenase E1 component [Paraburkholderia sp. T12-10]